MAASTMPGWSFMAMFPAREMTVSKPEMQFSTTKAVR
jgi:hypothetical protein